MSNKTSRGFRVEKLSLSEIRVRTREACDVAPQGEIAGVIVEKLVEHPDERGRVFEFYSGSSDFWSTPLVWGHCFTIRPRGLKGWGVHLEKTDRYCLIAGEIMTVLYDSRVASATFGLVQEVILSPEGNRLLKIPPGIWHLNVNLTDDEAFVIDLPSEPYRHSNPDKLVLPWDTPEIPYTIPWSVSEN